MADQFDALVSGSSGDPEQQRALAQALRRQSALGQMMQLTGDRTIAPAGESQQQDAVKQAGQIGSERQAQARLSQTLALQQASQAEEVRNHNMENQRSLENNKNNADTRKAINDQNSAIRQQMADIAQQNADQKGAAKAQGKPVPDGEFQKLAAMQDSVSSVTDAKNSFRPEYAGTGLPGGRNATNWLASNVPGVVTQNAQDANNFWQNYGRGFTLDEMHNKFGARLTKTEMDRFEQFHINPNMDPATISKNLDQIQSFLVNKLGRRVDELKAGGYSGDQLDLVDPRKSLPTGAPAAPKTGADKYRAQAAAPPVAAPAPAAPTPPPMLALPQAMNAQPKPQQAPFVPGLNNLFQGMPSGNG